MNYESKNDNNRRRDDIRIPSDGSLAIAALAGFAVAAVLALAVYAIACWVLS